VVRDRGGEEWGYETFALCRQCGAWKSAWLRYRTGPLVAGAEKTIRTL
jgi:hypothetical protein